jgi:hypothetical protein
VGNAIAKTGKDLQHVVAQANALLPRVNAGDKKAQAELRQILDGTPELWLGVGNLAHQAELAMIQVAAGDNDIMREAIQGQLAKLRRDLRGPEPTPLERLLVDRVVAGWLTLHYAEAKYHERLRKGLSWAENESYQRDMNHAHRRYLSAIRTLATVRRLVPPTLQVNIADQQVNVAR